MWWLVVARFFPNLLIHQFHIVGTDNAISHTYMYVPTMVLTFSKPSKALAQFVYITSPSFGKAGLWCNSVHVY